MTETERHELHTRLQQALGDDAAGVLMALLPPVGWADVATKADLRALESSLRGEMSGLRGEFHHEIGGLRGELHHEIGALRGELHREVGGLHAAMRQQTIALVATMVTISGVTFAATALLG